MHNIITSMSNFSSTVTFKCPIPHCGQDVILSITSVTEHIQGYHSRVNEKMGYPKTIGYCKDCNSYTRFKHFHCHECSESKYFRTQDEMNAHLKDQHAKWWFEFKCKHELGCYGLSGKCGFNHRITDKDYIDNEEVIPAGVCRDDCPWDGVRCMRAFCSFDHFRGRVKFLIAMKAKARRMHPVAAAVSENAVADEYEEDFEAEEAACDAKEDREQETADHAELREWRTDIDN